MDLDYKASKDLAETAVWSEKLLRHAREHGQRKLVWLLKAVRADVEFEGALPALLPQEHLSSARGGYGEEFTHNNDRIPDTANDVRKREQDQEKVQARIVAWELFMETERRDLRLRQDGLVALMSTGKMSYKHLDELSPEDMPARAAAKRLRTTWLKERRDGWHAREPGGRA